MNGGLTFNTQSWLSLTFCAIVCLFLSYSSCLTPSTLPTHLQRFSNLLDQKIQKKIYIKSINDSKEHTLDKKTKKLVSIVPWNNKLVWSNDQKRILVTSYMGHRAIDKFWRPYKIKELPPSVDCWVITVPELKNLGLKTLNEIYPNGIPSRLDINDKKHVDAILAARINQHLGLIPTKAKKGIVEMWVRPKDLIRPCLNSEITDEACTLDLPKEKLPGSYKDMFVFINATPEYQAWFNARKDSIYTSQLAFPWTRLGYTYDWSPDSKNHVGASEFVIKFADIEGISVTRFTMINEVYYSLFDYITSQTPKNKSVDLSAFDVSLKTHKAALETAEIVKKAAEKTAEEVKRANNEFKALVNSKEWIERKILEFGLEEPEEKSK